MKPSASRTVLSLFRGLVRAARSLDVALSSLPAEADAAQRARTRIAALLPGTSAALPVRVARAFRDERALSAGPATDAAVAAAFAGLRAANAHLGELKAAAQSTTSTHQSSAPAPLAVGHVVVHRHFGYRAVVTAVHARCEASTVWRARNADVSTEQQPFYTLLVDTRDRAEAQVTYAAHENVTRVAAFIEHPLIGKVFKEYHARESLYVLREAGAGDGSVESGAPTSPKAIVGA